MHRMNILNNICLIPVGCSCINQFQLNFLVENNPDAYGIRGLFDWNIVSPQSTIEVLQSIVEGSVYKIFTTRENYTIERGRLKKY